MEDTFRDIQSKLRENRYANEEQVKLSLVARLLKDLGWDIWNPLQVRFEFSAVPREDTSRVDIALFLEAYTPRVFIEVKAVGKLDYELERTEQQLRDYNRNNTAAFSIITDGRKWRFYLSQTGGEFSKKCFKVVDVADNDLDSLKRDFTAFLSRSEIESGAAQRNAESYLRLSQKQRAMEDLLPKARHLVQEPPFQTLPDALCKLCAEAGCPIALEEAEAFIMRAQIEKPPPPPATHLEGSGTRPSGRGGQSRTISHSTEGC